MYVFCMSLRIKSDYFSTQCFHVGLLYDMDCVISGVKTEFLYTISINFGLSRVNHYTATFG